MDNPDSTNEIESGVFARGDAAPHVEPREVLEGDIVQPIRRIDSSDEPQAYRDRAEATPGPDGGASAGHESVERGLAQYVFVREDRDREVRLTFRDASPNDIAQTFRTAGAHLITLSAERASMRKNAAPTPAPTETTPEGESDPTGEDIEAEERAPRHRPHRHKTGKAIPSGEVLLRYFYALGETVYTINIVSPTGVATSISGTYPLAARSERELMDRLAVVFI